jgi:hypothetical protein
MWSLILILFLNRVNLNCVFFGMFFCVPRLVNSMTTHPESPVIYGFFLSHFSPARVYIVH